MSRLSILEPHIQRQGFLLLDGGLATELEAAGHDLSDALWSARLLLDDPGSIVRVHRRYLEAGADCIITASYQATVAGFMARGLNLDRAEALLLSAVTLAEGARDAFWSSSANRAGRLQPLVAASVGPYGAYLADGSEYRGEYGLSIDELVSFHRPRWHLLAGSSADLLACETIPSAMEVHAIANLARETPEAPIWVSLSCRDERHINDGTPIAEAVAPLLSLPQVVALGVNCTAPGYVIGLLSALAATTEKPLLAYPNSGERYDAEGNCWVGTSAPVEFGQEAKVWYSAGARLIGGCCRTGPAHIRQMRRALMEAKPAPTTSAARG